MIRKQLRPAIVMTLLLCVITGLVYPGVVTASPSCSFPSQANGSLVTVKGSVVGSALIGQPFTAPYYFHPRPSAAGAGYDATASAGTNKGPTDRKLADTLIAQARGQVVRGGRRAEGEDPVGHGDGVGVGARPAHLPRQRALQVGRVARARGADSAAVRALLDAHTEGRQFGFFGEPASTCSCSTSRSTAPSRGAALVERPAATSAP